jgi:LysM repeat protein
MKFMFADYSPSGSSCICLTPISHYGKMPALCLPKSRQKEGSVKSILVSRPSFFTLVLMLALGLVACERPLQGEEESAPASTPSVEATREGREAPLKTPAASGELFQPDTEGGLEDSIETDPVAAESVDVQEETLIVYEPVTHIIQDGDSLFTVAQRYNVSLDDLAAANNLDVNTLLSPGATLIIPIEDTSSTDNTLGESPLDGEVRIHIVQAGENLYRIGLVYGFTIEEITAYNSLENPDYIDVGQEIRIPPDSTP